jgi:hypothetical protein
MIKLFLAVLSVTSFAGIDAAEACRRNMLIPERIARSGADTIVLAEVKGAAYLAGAAADTEYRAWEGSIFLKRILKGQTAVRNFRIGRSGSTAACDDGIPAPKLGDAWVVYFKNGEQPSPEHGFWNSYPLEIARQADPRLDEMLTASNIR